MDDFKQYFDTNQQLWNKRTAVHIESPFYNLSGFLKGEQVLAEIELSELGDVSGKTLLHLQCHFGLDTLSWARRGAIVTGVDISDESISQASRLNEQLALNARFIHSNIYDIQEKLEGTFDIVFTSYGTVGWLPDLNKWASIISSFLAPGGFFYMADFHPVIWMFDDDFTHFKYSYFNQNVIELENQPTYTDETTAIPNKEFSWNHSVSEILNALIKAGMTIEFFNEHDYSPYPNFANSVETQKGKWQIAGLEGKLPVVYSLRAVKQ